MAIVGYAGPLPVAVLFKWKSDVVANALTTLAKNYPFVIMNELLTAFEITGTVGATSTSITRKATSKNRFFDDKLGMYTTDPVSGAELEKLVDPAAAATFKVDLTITFATFFDVLLDQMTRTDADLHNLANPNDSNAILSTFKHSVTGGSVNITYESKTQWIKAIKCRLIDKDVKPGKAGKAPAVKLVFELDFGRSGLELQGMRNLIAMDWTKLARFGKPSAGTQKDVKTWRLNVITYLANQTDISRGERFRQAIIARHVGKSPKQLATDLRDDIDLHLVTANHWGQAREDMTTEKHQRLLSDLFGTLHQTTWLSSPVSLNRGLSSWLKFEDDLDKIAALSLQYGTGHCGEHGQTSFSILRSIMKAPGNQVASAVLSGNANIDHMFVVYNLVVERSIFTTATSPANTCVSVGDQIEVFDLRDAIAKNPTREGFVMDPYLDKTVMKPTAVELLAALNSPKRQGQGKDTDFLAFNEQHPKPSGFVRDDIHSKPAAELKKLVKHV